MSINCLSKSGNVLDIIVNDDVNVREDHNSAAIGTMLLLSTVFSRCDCKDNRAQIHLHQSLHNNIPI